MSAFASEPRAANHKTGTEGRLDSWKEIAAYLKHGIRTVQRWERHERLPVHRHVHDKLATVYAYKQELDSWWNNYQVQFEQENITDSIVVLPFVNMSSDKENEYFSDGMTEELINTLSKVAGLRVASRTSAFQFKGKAQDIRRIAEQLQVGTVLEGSVRKAENKLRIAAQLFNASTGDHLWSEVFERRMEDIFAIQSEISTAIANTLRIRLVGGVRKPLVKHYTNMEAYTLYLRGRYYWNKRTEDGLKKAVDYFTQATEQDPRYPLAYVGLADSYALLGCGQLASLPPLFAMPKAKRAAVQALELDDSLPEARASLGFIRSRYDWDWAGGEQEFRRTIEQDPGYATAHHWYSVQLAATGRTREGLAEIKRAVELDPLSLVINTDLAAHFYLARQYERAIEQCLKTLELEPDYVQAHFQLGLALQEAGKLKDAISHLQKARNLSKGGSAAIGALANAYAVSGRRAEAMKLVGELKEKSQSQYVSSFDMAVACTGLDQRSEALEWLERAVEERADRLIFLNTKPTFDSLRSEPRFINLLKRVGFLQPERS